MVYFSIKMPTKIWFWPTTRMIYRNAMLLLKRSIHVYIYICLHNVYLVRRLSFSLCLILNIDLATKRCCSSQSRLLVTDAERVEKKLVEHKHYNIRFAVLHHCMYNKCVCVWTTYLFLCLSSICLHGMQKISPFSIRLSDHQFFSY